MKRDGAVRRSLWKDRRGIAALEYALIFGLGGIMVAFVVTSLGGDLFITMIHIAELMHLD